jgi:hypothetical protein
MLEWHLRDERARCGVFDGPVEWISFCSSAKRPFEAFLAETRHRIGEGNGQ